MRRKITPAFISKSLQEKKKWKKHEKELLALELSLKHWKENLAEAKKGLRIDECIKGDWCACCQHAKEQWGFTFGRRCFVYVSMKDKFLTCPLATKQGCCNGLWRKVFLAGNTKAVEVCKALVSYIEERQQWYRKQCTTQP